MAELCRRLSPYPLNEPMMTRFAMATAAVLFGCGAAHAQARMNVSPLPALGMTSPLGIPNAPVGTRASHGRDRPRNAGRESDHIRRFALDRRDMRGGLAGPSVVHHAKSDDGSISRDG